NLDFLKRFRSLLDEYPGSAAVGEVGDAERGLEIVAQYTSGDERVHMCYAFDFLTVGRPNATIVRDVIKEFEQEAADGWACWAFSNHDVQRHSSRWTKGVDDSEALLKMALTLILSLRGSVCLYQGEELGLDEADVPFEALQDPYGIRFWPKFKGRDGCRTPMIWNHNGLNGGFSDGKPWLPIPGNHMQSAADKQEGSPDSVLSHYRAALAFRAKYLEFAKGSIRFIGNDKDVLVLERAHADAVMFVAINMSEHAKSIEACSSDFQQLSSPGATGNNELGKINLPPFGSYFARKQLKDGGAS
ncbi:MAG: alpha-amylase family glycosyl hydrolase, partial [Pseudomonadota bacterium]